MADFELISGTSAPPSARLAALADEAWAYHHTLAEYHETPCHRLPALAAAAGIGDLLLKDESSRFGLGAFKGLGASFALHRWFLTHPGWPAPVFTTATDGNHGRAVAWAARRHGARAVIYVPAHTVAARIEAIAREGAEVITVPEGYDAAVARARNAAREHGWVVIQDGGEDVADEISEWIAAGYWTHARELEPAPFAATEPEVDLVVLHAGVGTWPAAIAAYLWHRYGSRRPRVMIVEPEQAACVLAAIRAGMPVTAPGSRETIMAGLNCGRAAATALPALGRGADAFVAIADRWAEAAMRHLAHPEGGDPKVVAGESGAASVAGLLAVMAEPDLAPVRDHLGLGPWSRVLVWSTEGATDPVGWARVVGEPVPS